jgi:hypothetical protein
LKPFLPTHELSTKDDGDPDNYQLLARFDSMIYINDIYMLLYVIVIKQEVLHEEKMGNLYRISADWGITPIPEADRSGVLLGDKTVAPFNTDMAPLYRRESLCASTADTSGQKQIQEQTERSRADQTLLERARLQTSMYTDLLMDYILSAREKKGISRDQPVRKEELQRCTEVLSLVNMVQDQQIEAVKGSIFPNTAVVMLKELARHISPEAAQAFAHGHETIELELTDGKTHESYEKDRRIFNISDTATLAEATLAMVGLAVKTEPRYYWHWPVSGDQRAERMSMITRANMHLGKYGAPPEHNPLEKNVYLPAFERGILAARNRGEISEQTSVEEIRAIGHEAGRDALRHLAEKVLLPIVPERSHQEYRRAGELNIQPFHRRDDPRFITWMSEVLKAMETSSQLEARTFTAVDITCKWSVTQDKTFRVLPAEGIRVKGKDGETRLGWCIHPMAALDNKDTYYDGTIISGGRMTWRIFPPSSPDEAPRIELVELNGHTGHYAAAEAFPFGIEAGIANNWFSEEEVEKARLRVPIPIGARKETAKTDQTDQVWGDDVYEMVQEMERQRPHIGPGKEPLYW